MVDCFCCPVVLLCRYQRRQCVLEPPRLWLRLCAVVLRSGSFVLRSGPQLLRSGPDLLCAGSRRCAVLLRPGPGSRAELLRSGSRRCAVVLRSGPELWLWLHGRS